MAEELSPPARRGTLAVICLATAMLMLDIAVVNVALPYLARDLHSGPGGLQWVADGYTLAVAAVVLSAGSAADRLGRRRVFTAGLAVFTAASATCAVAGSVVLLDAARAGQGLAAALVQSSPMRSPERGSARARWPPTARRSGLRSRWVRPPAVS